MKTLIIFATTYGYTEQCAKTLAEKLQGDADLVNILKEKSPSLLEYDKIIIGGSIYMGQINKKLKEYCIQNETNISSKQVGLFICCGFRENLENYLSAAFPKGLVEKAVAIECFGGELDLNKMNTFHRFVTTMVTKASEKEGKKGAMHLPENITKMADKINQL